MALLVCCSVRRSILNRSSIVAFCAILAFSATSALAQRPAAGAMPAAHMSPAPGYRVRISPAPAFHTPITSPRTSPGWSSGTTGSFHFPPPRRPIRPFPPLFFLYWSPFAFGQPFSGFNCWSANCDLLWTGLFDYETVSSPGPVNYVSAASEAPAAEYGDYGEETPEIPQLYLKDGSVLSVTDYWLVDDQLHFKIIQEYGAKPTEEVIPVEALDLQKTVDVNTRRGFHFMLRNEPFEQYVRDHPEGAPQTLTPQ